jgi:hypothetical protein
MVFHQISLRDNSEASLDADPYTGVQKEHTVCKEVFRFHCTNIAAGFSRFPVGSNMQNLAN